MVKVRGDATITCRKCKSCGHPRAEKKGWVIAAFVNYLSMDETADKGMEVKGANRESREIGRIIVTGYDTGRPLGHVESELRKLYASCGEITDVCITVVN